MARPRQFDEDEALMQALLVFWQRGYEGCSIRDLLDATGLPRQSLYNTFGDKRSLFLRALDRYRQRVVQDLAPLKKEGATLGDLRTYMLGALGAQAELGGGACLLVVTAFGPAAADPDVQAAIEAGAVSVRNAFSALLTRLRDDGSLPYETDPETHAAYLYSVLNGMSALQRTGGSRAQIQGVLDATLRAL